MWKTIRHSTSIFCILLSLLAGGLWVRSFWVSHVFAYFDEQSGSDYAIDFVCGRVIVDYHRLPNIPAPYTGFSTGYNDRPDSRYANDVELDVRTNGGIAVAGFYVRRRTDIFAMIIPPWAIVAFVVGLLIIPVYDLRSVVRLRRGLIDRLCAKCHYDLRASTTTCPECGAPIDRQTGGVA